MEATVTQSAAITEAQSRRVRMKTALEVAMHAIAEHARGEAHDSVLGGPDAEGRLSRGPRAERERMLARGFGRAR